MNENQNRYSCADFTFPLLSHEKALRLIELLGIEAVDLGIFEGRSHYYPSQIARDPVAIGRKLANELKAAGLKAADVFLQTGDSPEIAAANSPDRNVRENNRELFLRTLDFVNTLGCSHITGLPGVAHTGERPDDDWNRSCEETQWRLEKARNEGIIYSIEPHAGSILNDPETTLKFINDCPGITLTLDYGHFIYQGQKNERVHPLINYASHFHARCGAKGKLQATFSENEIDFKTIVSRFNEIEYSGYSCLEYVYVDWEGCNRTDNVSETIRLYEYLRQLRHS
jgi:sugar phosphate isomerase/epimerase